jgi:hypothetical protein
MSIYQHKIVDGVLVELTQQEIDALEQRDADFAAQPPAPPTIEERLAALERMLSGDPKSEHNHAKRRTQ